MKHKRKQPDDNKIRVQFLGAVNNEVTGSCTYLKIDNLNILVDFGMIQNNTIPIDQLYKMNSKKLPIPISEIDYVIILHSHYDHSSRIGVLNDASGFRGKIITTELTAMLMKEILTDSAHIMIKECTRVNKHRQVNKLYPIYSTTDVSNVMETVRCYDFHRQIALNERVSLTLIPSGHLSGASMGVITYTQDEHTKKRILFTSDTSASRAIPFTMKPNIQKMKFDLIVTESTYGNREHEDVDPKKQLEEAIRDTVLTKGKTLIIPAFAVGRSTNVLLMLKQLYDEYKEFEPIDLYLASPMAINAHNIIGSEESFCYYDEEWKQYKDLFKWEKVQMVKSFDVVQSQLVNDKPKIIVSASGMMDNGYVKYLASYYLAHKGNKILLTGYQTQGSLGRKLLDGLQKSVTIDGVSVPIKADIDILKNMSSHASAKEIVNMLKTVEKKRVRKICIVHGQEEAKEAMRELLKKEFNCEIIIPTMEQIVKI